MNKTIKHDFHYVDSLQDEWQSAYSYARGYLLECRLKGRAKDLINLLVCHLDDEIRDIVKKDLAK